MIGVPLHPPGSVIAGIVVQRDRCQPPLSSIGEQPKPMQLGKDLVTATSGVTVQGKASRVVA